MRPQSAKSALPRKARPPFFNAKDFALKVQTPTLGFEAQLVNYLVKQFFNGDVKRFAEQVEYTENQVERWRSGKQKPQKPTIQWMLSAAIAPEFRIACEFEPVNLTAQTEISSVLKRALGTHAGKTGVYAFYDSMCNVI